MPLRTCWRIALRVGLNPVMTDEPSIGDQQLLIGGSLLDDAALGDLEQSVEPVCITCAFKFMPRGCGFQRLGAQALDQPARPSSSSNSLTASVLSRHFTSRRCPA